MNGRRIYWLGLCLWSAFGLVLQIKAQESGDGFSQSDRDMLRDVRSIASGNSTKLTTIQQVVQNMSPVVDQIQSDVEEIADEISELKSAQSYFNNVQYNMANLLDNWNSTGLPGTEDLPLIQLNTYNAATHLSYIRTDVNDILDNTTQMNGHLLNIDRETTESSDYLHSIDQTVQYLASLVERISTNRASTVDISAISNAISQLNVSAPVDMGMVTNLYLSLFYPYDLFNHNAWAMESSFKDWYDSYTEITGILGPAQARYAQFLSRSSFGLMMALMDSALVSESSLPRSRNPWAYAADYWFGSSHSDFQYSIFDAYNTFGLGVLTNQMITVSNVLGEVRDLLASNVSQVVKVNTSIGYDDSQDEDLNLEHGDDSRLPEWEERYQGHLADWTNSYYYESIFQGSYSRMAEASNVVNDFFTQLDQTPGDFHHTLTWSGLSFGRDNPIGGWDLNVTISKDDPNYADVRSFTNGVFSVSMAFLNLCIVAYFMRRIYGKLMKSPLL